MHLLLLRHSLAAGRAPAGGGDAARLLTADGHRRAAAVATRLATLGLPVTRILTSPYARARETAAICADALGGAPVQELWSLTPDGEPAAALAEVAAYAAEEPGVLLVTHQPMVSALAAHLLGHEAASVAFEPATLAAFLTDGLPPRFPSTLLFAAPARLLGSPV